MVISLALNKLRLIIIMLTLNKSILMVILLGSNKLRLMGISLALNKSGAVILFELRLMVNFKGSGWCKNDADFLRP